MKKTCKTIRKGRSNQEIEKDILIGYNAALISLGIMKPDERIAGFVPDQADDGWEDFLHGKRKKQKK